LIKRRLSDDRKRRLFTPESVFCHVLRCWAAEGNYQDCVLGEYVVRVQTWVARTNDIGKGEMPLLGTRRGREEQSKVAFDLWMWKSEIWGGRWTEVLIGKKIKRVDPAILITARNRIMWNRSTWNGKLRSNQSAGFCRTLLPDVIWGALSDLAGATDPCASNDPAAWG
jgi:hypothetical protein